MSGAAGNTDTLEESCQ
jgi:hypothetical protein